MGNYILYTQLANGALATSASAATGNLTYNTATNTLTNTLDDWINSYVKTTSTATTANINNNAVWYDTNSTWYNTYDNLQPFCNGIIQVLKSEKYFADLPMIKYKLQVSGYFGDYLKTGWPVIIGKYKDWIQITNLPSDFNTIEVIVPLHIRLQTGMKIAPLNQYDRKVENKDIIDYINK